VARVTLDPPAGTVAVSATATLEPPEGEAGAGVISFFLDRGLEVSGAEVDGIPAAVVLDNDAERASFAPSARSLRVAGPAEPGESVRLSLRYEGRIAGGGRSVSRITAGLTELNLYAAWLPLFEGPQGFEYEIEVTAPESQRIVGNGEIAPAAAPGGERAVFKGRSAAGDVPLILSPSIRDVAVEGDSRCALEILAPDLPEGIASWIAAEAARGCGLLSSWLDASEPAGGAAGRAHRMRIAVVPREGDGYARPPLVVLPAGWFTEAGLEGPVTEAERTETLRRVFHEMAHGFAPLADTHTSDDWINEGLAEFLSREVLEATGRGEAVAGMVREDLLEIAGRAPAPPTGAPAPGPDPGGDPTVLLAPISATRRSDPDAHLLFYVKGTQVVRMLSGLLGSDLFHDALRDLRTAYPPWGASRMTTGDFLSALQAASGFPLDWVRREWIDGSGLPGIESRLEVARGGLGGGIGTIVPLRGGGGPSRVTGRIVQTGAKPFHLVLPIEARRGDLRERSIVKAGPGESRVERLVPFAATEAVLDPDLLVPRIDATVKEALRLVEIASRAALLTREGLAAERAGNFAAAVAGYTGAIAADPSAILARYRKARVDAALGRHEVALSAHQEAGRIANRVFAARARLRASIPPGAGAAEAPALLWLPEEPDLRSWNEVRIGQMEDLLGRRGAARRAYRRALRYADLHGAHDEAERCLKAPCVQPAGSGLARP